MSGDLFLRDVIELPESVHAGDFKVELSGGFAETAQRVEEYVVTDQLRFARSRTLLSVSPPNSVRIPAACSTFIPTCISKPPKRTLRVQLARLLQTTAATAHTASSARKWRDYATIRRTFLRASLGSIFASSSNAS